MGDNLNGYYRLGKSIQAEGSNWTPVGTGTQEFQGQLDGRGYEIRGLSINISGLGEQVAGLFGVVGASGQIFNLGLLNVDITTSSSNGDSSAGGLAGINKGTITNCYSTGKVSSASPAGGLVGSNKGSIANSYAMGDVSSSSSDSSYAGGLVGLNDSGGTVTDSYATGNASAPTSGGFAGVNKGTITNSYATGGASSSAAPPVPVV